MKNSSSFLGILLTLTLATGATAQTQAPIQLNFEHRPALLYLNPSAMPTTPLIIALHGGGGSAAQFSKHDRTQLIQEAFKHGFSVVFPNGYSSHDSGIMATWNAGECCGQARDQHIDDVAYLTRLTKHLHRTYAVLDPQYTYATGMSNGGMMAYRLACEAPEVFSAVASVAGTLSLEQCSSEQPISILHIHAVDDERVLYEGGRGPQRFPKRQQIADFRSVSYTIQEWSRLNQCRLQTSSPGPQEIHLETHTQCLNDTQVQLVTLPGGGHSWPGTTDPRKTPFNWNASEYIVKFFEAHRRGHP